MTEFTKKECLRLIDKLTETDPTTEAYHILLSSIERFDSIGNTVDEIAQLREGATEHVVIDVAAIKEKIQKLKEAASTPTSPPEDATDSGFYVATSGAVIPFETTDFPAEVKDDLVKDAPPPVEEETYTSSQVRKALVDARKNGVDVKALLAEFGADNFSAVPAGKYGAIMRKLGA